MQSSKTPEFKLITPPPEQIIKIEVLPNVIDWFKYLELLF